MNKRKICHLFVMAMVLMTSTLTHATRSYDPRLESVSNPAMIERRLDEINKIPSSKAVEPRIDPSSKPLLPKGAELITLNLKEIKFIGNSVFSQQELSNLSAFYLNRDIKLADFYALVEKVTLYYRDKGYILSQAIVPPQEINTKNKTATIRIIEGYIDQIKYEGKVHKLSPRARQFAEKIKFSRPLNAADLERYLLLMKDLPGLDIKTIIKPSDVTPGASTIIIIVDKKIVDLSVGVNNFGSRYVGPITSRISVGINSLMNIDDQFILQFTTSSRTRELKTGHIGYNQFLGTEGTRMRLSGSITETKPGDQLSILDIRGINKALKVEIEHPFIRLRSKSLYIGCDFSLYNVNSSLIGGAAESKDKLRTLSGNAKLDWADGYEGINLVTVAVTKGLKSLGATSINYDAKSRSKGKPDFTKINTSFSRLQHLVDSFSTFIIIEHQQAFDPLLSSERFSYGASSFFRTYTDAPITGDTGIREKIELRYDQVLPYGEEAAWLSSYQLYGFYGFGTIWNKSPSASEKNRISAGETGLGIRAVICSDTHISFEYTRPLREKINGFKNPNTLFFSLTQKL